MSRSELNFKFRKLIFQSNLPYKIRKLQNSFRYKQQRSSNSQRYNHRRGKIKNALIVFGLVAVTIGGAYAKGYSRALQDSWGTIQEGAKSKAFKTYVHELIDPSKMPSPSNGAIDKSIDSLFGSR